MRRSLPDRVVRPVHADRAPDPRPVIVIAAATIMLASCVPWRVPPSPPVPGSAIGRTISRQDAIDDLDTLLRTLDNVHPDLYAVRSRDSVAAARARLVAALPPAMTRPELWIRLAPLVAELGDGHTSVYWPGEEVARMQHEGALVFPPSVALDDSRRLVVSAVLGPDNGLERGDRIVALNGLNADSLVAAWTREMSGESEAFRTAQVVGGFRDLQLLHAIHAPYVLEIATSAGARRTITLPGLLQDSLRALVARGQTRRSATPNFTYRVLAPGIGYMNFRSLAGDLPHFKTDVATMFRQVAADSDRTLIIDLRGNGGGDSRLGDALLEHLTTKPYRGSAQKDWKMSAEYRSYLRSFVPPPLGWLPVWNLTGQGREMFHGPVGKFVTTPEEPNEHPRAEPFFSGAVCVLIGPLTFSSAVDFADAVKTYHLATLIGEETGGRPNSFGEVYIFRLPHSQLAASVSSARFVRANGDTTDHRGVVPDIVVRPSEADRRAGRDAALDRARSCPAID